MILDVLLLDVVFFTRLLESREFRGIGYGCALALFDVLAVGRGWRVVGFVLVLCCRRTSSSGHVGRRE